MQQALDKRVEVAHRPHQHREQQMNLVGIKNSLKPTLQAFAELTNNALAGQLTALGAIAEAGFLPGDMATCWRRFSGATIRITPPDCR